MSVDSPVSTSGLVAADWKPVQRIDARSVAYETFLADFAHADQPVVVSGVASDWKAMRAWTPKYFKERFGDKPVAVGYERNMPFDEFIDQVLASTPARPGPYMYRSFLHEHLPELLPDVIPQNAFSYPRRHASPLMPEKWRRPDGYLKLLIGGPGSKFPAMHFDGENAHAAITQIHGDKEFILYPPSDGEYLYPRKALPNQSRVDDPVMQDRGRFPLLAKATQYRTLMRPGDMIFVPAGWWHAARALSVSVSVCSNMLDASNWNGFLAEVERGEKTSAWKRRWLLFRLRWTGRLLDRLEALQQRRPALARALVFPGMLAPLTARSAPEPSRRRLRIRIPTA